jgi:hypothetical protein
MTAKEMFAKLGFVVKENNLNILVHSGDTYISYLCEDRALKIIFDRDMWSVEVSFYKYESVTDTPITSVESGIIKAIAKQIEEIEVQYNFKKEQVKANV